MGRTNSPRYEAFTTTRFYPTMMGRNLTFAPSQYGDAAPTGAPDAVAAPTAPAGVEGAGKTSLWGELGKLVGGVGTQAAGFFASEYQKDREAARSREDKLAEARLQTEQAKAQMIAGSFKPPEEPSVWPLVVGGTVVLGGLLVGGYFLTRN
jgi:hypothetical protein